MLLHLQYVTDVWRDTSVELLEKWSKYSSQRGARFKEWKINVACLKKDREMYLYVQNDTGFGVWDCTDL